MKATKDALKSLVAGSGRDGVDQMLAMIAELHALWNICLSIKFNLRRPLDTCCHSLLKATPGK